MRNFAILGASTLVLAFGVGAASAEPFNPVTGYSNAPVSGYSGAYVLPGYGFNGSLNEGRSAFEGGYNNSWTAGDPILEQFHEAGRGSSSR